MMSLNFAILCLLSASIVESAPVKSNFKLTLVHNNDMHSRFEQTGAMSDRCKDDASKCYGGFARISQKLKEIKKRSKDGEIANVLFLNAGDVYVGSPLFNIYKENISAEFMNALKPDVAVSCLLLGISHSYQVLTF